MPQTKVRVVGSSFTTFRWRGKDIAFLDGMQDSGQQPIAPPDVIHPLDKKYPVEFATARAMSEGTLTFTVRELWNMPVWQHFAGLEQAKDIIDIWERMSADPTSITCQTIIKPPQGNVWRVKTYHNVMISAVDDSEQIQIGTLSVARSVTALYTHATRETIPVGTTTT